LPPQQSTRAERREHRPAVARDPPKSLLHRLCGLIGTLTCPGHSLPEILHHHVEPVSLISRRQGERSHDAITDRPRDPVRNPLSQGIQPSFGYPPQTSLCRIERLSQKEVTTKAPTGEGVVCDSRSDSKEKIDKGGCTCASDRQCLAQTRDDLNSSLLPALSF
jgi:hypothetical protein